MLPGCANRECSQRYPHHDRVSAATTIYQTGGFEQSRVVLGDASALQALERNGKREPVQVDIVVVYYPVCIRVHKFNSDVPVLVLAGDFDTVAPMSECETLFGELPKRENFTVRVYDGANHGFDISDLPDNKLYMGALGYNKAAASSAWSELAAFLRK